MVAPRSCTRSMMAMPSSVDGPRRSVPLGEHQHVTGPQRLDGLVEPRSSPHGFARRLVLKDRIAAFLVQSSQLPAEVLPVGADAGVAHFSVHPTPSPFFTTCCPSRGSISRGFRPTRIGYARVSSVDQNLDRQIASLRTAGCEVIYREKASGKNMKLRPELERAIDRLGIGDVLVVAEWDRATRSMMDGIAIMQRVAARDAAIKVLDKPYLDLTTAIGRGGPRRRPRPRCAPGPQAQAHRAPAARGHRAPGSRGERQGHRPRHGCGAHHGRPPGAVREGRFQSGLRTGNGSQPSARPHQDGCCKVTPFTGRPPHDVAGGLRPPPDYERNDGDRRAALACGLLQ